MLVLQYKRKYSKVGENMSDEKYELVKAFPKELKEDTLRVLDMMNLKIRFSNCFEVHYKGSTLNIPERIYYDEASLSQYNSLTDRQQIILNCLFTRHNVGYVREENLKKIIHQCSEYNWIVPYLMRLTGEYVIEILQVIKENIGNLDKGTIQEFIGENAGFYNTIESQIVSYWDCYYRSKYPVKTDYVGFVLIEYFRS